ncbi:NmrA family NAD(P)-binding protein [Microcella daejeonensis]|uniref:NmrA family NAD(P)-binding protein n=1 Tax=Microcella daejeonensis TaxID=2994971 RepID=A0A9E8MJV3_9MICO|nr:NmrA family NAD(P)-binding protein [Microcella daejeonensis]WAB80879.1 NmrA family NAD(P)-binding protein [Microcella daejeonensis]
MTIVVTGATGHLGRLIIDALIARGVEPAAIVGTGRAVERSADLTARGVRIVAAAYDDAAAMDAALADAETLMLVSGSEVGARVAQHAAAIEAAQRAGVRRIVYTSVLDAADSPLVLAPEHAATERLLADSGLAVTVLRNGWYTENYLGAVQQAAQSGALLTSAGQGRVASASRRDYAEAAAAVITGEGHEGAVYELSGDVAWGFDELAAAASTVTGATIAVQQVTPEQHVAALTGAGLDAGTAGFVVALDGDIRSGLLASTSGDLARLIGRPTTPLEQSLRAALAG